jgi:hypothetical protein
MLSTLLLASLALAGIASAQCAADCDANGAVTVDELVAAVASALGGCDSIPLSSPCAPRGIITEPQRFLPSPDHATARDGGVLQINDAVYQASGFGNMFTVVTSEGNVIIDTSVVLSAAAHKRALQAIDDGPVRYIILTHAHADHVGGVGLWKEEGTKVVAQGNHTYFQNGIIEIDERLGSEAAREAE